MKLLRTINSLLIIFFLLPIIKAQNNTKNEVAIIKGVITDGSTGESLPAATVIIKETTIGTITDSEGKYLLKNVPPGNHTLLVKFIGYKEKTVDLFVKAGDNITQNVELSFAAFETEEVVITAQASGQVKAINQQLAAKSISNIVSKEKIEELPDANVAEAIGRLPGISLQRDAGEANKVVIRGLSPKYNNVTIEGMKMPSTNSNDRSVDLSLIQNESLSGIEVTKSLRADMDADALGGTVNLRLKTAPKKRQVFFSAEGGYADISQEFRNYKIAGGASDRIFNDKLGISISLTAEQKQLPSHTFTGDYSSPYWQFQTGADDEYIDSTLLIDTESMELVNRTNTRKRYSVSGVIDFNNGWWDLKFYNLYNRKNDDRVVRENSYHFLHSALQDPYRFEKTVHKQLWGSDLRTHTIKNTFSFLGTELNVNASATFAKTIRNQERYPFAEEGLWRDDIPQSWLSYRQPDQAIDSMRPLIVENTYLQAFNLSNQELTDKNYDVRLDYKIPFTIKAGLKGNVQFGFKYHKTIRISDQEAEYSNFRHGGGRDERTFLADNYEGITLSAAGNQLGVDAFNFVDEGYSPGDFLNGRYELGWGADLAFLSNIQEQFHSDPNAPPYWTDGLESHINDYEATENLQAGYIMTEINVGKSLMFIPGVRYENMTTDYFTYHIKLASLQTGIEPNPDSVNVNRKNADWYPSLNIKYELNDHVQIQGAAYKSTSRPDFTQISPLVVYHHKNPVIFSNNPYLKPSKAWNFDLGMSVYSNKIGLLSAFVYYKEVQDLIFGMQNYKPAKKGEIVGGPDDIEDRMLGDEYYNEQHIETSTKVNILPFNNPEKTTVKGVELSWQTNFWYLPGALSGLVMDLNMSLINSKTVYPFFQSTQIGIDSSGFIPKPIYGQEYVVREGAMVDQPKFILNLVLGWDYKGFSARVSYRFQDKTLKNLDTQYSIYDRYYDTFSLIDIMLKQKITPNLTTFINLTNVTNHVDEYYFKEQTSKPALPTRSEFYGFRGQAGIKLNF